MSKVTLALGSFIVGACFAFAISAGTQTSTWAQMAGGTSLVVIPAAEPVVPNLISVFSGMKLTSGKFQQLDGIDCEHCIIDSPVLTYAGGLYRLNGAVSARPMRLVLKGPALNTWGLLNQLGAFRTTPSPPFSPPKFLETHANSVTIEVQATKPTTINLASLFK